MTHTHHITRYQHTEPEEGCERCCEVGIAYAFARSKGYDDGVAAAQAAARTGKSEAWHEGVKAQAEGKLD